MDESKIKIKIIREDTIIISKSQLAKISTPSDVDAPTIDIEGKRYYVTSWTADPVDLNRFGINYRISLVGRDIWELT